MCPEAGVGPPERAIHVRLTRVIGQDTCGMVDVADDWTAKVKESYVGRGRRGLSSALFLKVTATCDLPASFHRCQRR
eukprot:8663078-Pyramimonas_sp.AAC.1